MTRNGYFRFQLVSGDASAVSVPGVWGDFTIMTVILFIAGLF